MQHFCRVFCSSNFLPPLFAASFGCQHSSFFHGPSLRHTLALGECCALGEVPIRLPGVLRCRQKSKKITIDDRFIVRSIVHNIDGKQGRMTMTSQLVCPRQPHHDGAPGSGCLALLACRGRSTLSDLLSFYYHYFTSTNNKPSIDRHANTQP